MADYQVPADLKYTKSDEWVRMEGDEAVVGITDYAQNALNDITYVEVGVSGEVLKADEIFGSVESVKAASDLHAPLSGTVTAVNDDLEETPEKINTDPYGIAWLIKIKLSNRAELDGLMTPEVYQAYCAGRD